MLVNAATVFGQNYVSIVSGSGWPCEFGQGTIYIFLLHVKGERIDDAG
jgi:hypothetical protein